MTTKKCSLTFFIKSFDHNAELLFQMMLNKLTTFYINIFIGTFGILYLLQVTSGLKYLKDFNTKTKNNYARKTTNYFLRKKNTSAQILQIGKF